MESGLPGLTSRPTVATSWTVSPGSTNRPERFSGRPRASWWRRWPKPTFRRSWQPGGDTPSGSRPRQATAVAHNLRGKLLLVTGDLDDNVNPSATMQLVDALIKANRNFDLLVLSNRNYDFSGTWGLERGPYVTRRGWDYFVEHLMGEQPPPVYQVGAR